MSFKGVTDTVYLPDRMAFLGKMHADLISSSVSS